MALVHRGLVAVTSLSLFSILGMAFYDFSVGDDVAAECKSKGGEIMPWHSKPPNSELKGLDSVRHYCTNPDSLQKIELETFQFQLPH